MRPRFPYVLSLAAALVFAACVGLGLWQVQRFHWKQGQLAEIAARRTAPPQPIGPVLNRASRGEDVSFTRVAVDCPSAPAAPALSRVTTDNGSWVTRVETACRLAGAPYGALWVDRGFVDKSRGSTQPAEVALPAPVHVVGVLYRASRGGDSAPYVLVADQETPRAPGVTPAPYPDPAGNLQYAGEYAPTWFGLAGVLAAFYAALLWRRLRS